MFQRLSVPFGRLLLAGALVSTCWFVFLRPSTTTGQASNPSDPKTTNADALASQGRQIFRFDTFGDEVFWGAQLRLNEAIASSLSPRTALNLGLKVDVDVLPQQLLQRIRRGDVSLDNPVTTLTLLQLNAVVGLTGFFDASRSRLTSIGIQCALCHSTVND